MIIDILMIISDLHITQIPLFVITFVVIKFNVAQGYTIIYPLVVGAILLMHRTIVLIIHLHK